MGYELGIEIAGGWIEIEADAPRELERRVAALDLRALEAAIAKARGSSRATPKGRAAAARSRARRSR